MTLGAGTDPADVPAPLLAVSTAILRTAPS